VTTPSESGIRLHTDGHIARITLDRPEHHNALQAIDLAALMTALDQVEANGAIRAVIVTGSGDSTFCSGASLRQMESGEMNGEMFEALTDRLVAVRPPTICGLNGSVYGGGAELALSCDFRIGVSGSRLSVTAAKLGICYPLGGVRRYVQRLGIGTTNRILLAAEEFDADEMLRTGFLTELVAPEALMSTVEALAARIAGLAPLAVQAMKQLIRGVAEGAIDADEARRLIAECADSSDLREGLRAYHEDRSPDFEGR
jgi:enoyl-CoA hydratase/carnithine racemase